MRAIGATAGLFPGAPPTQRLGKACLSHLRQVEAGVDRDRAPKKKKKVKTTSIICHLRAFCFFCYPTLRRYQTITVCSALAHPPFPHRVLFHKKTFYYGSAKILENANRKSRFLQPETPPAFVNEPDLRSVISSLRLCIFLLFSSQNI